MVTFRDLSDLNESAGIGDFLSLPNSIYPYFWAWILAGLWFIVTMTLYFNERVKFAKGNLISAMAVSSLAIIMLSTIGTIVGFVSLEIMIYILVIGFVFIGIWFFSD